MDQPKWSNASALDLCGLVEQQVTVVVTRNRAAQVNQVAHGIELHDFQFLNCDAIDAVVTSHAFALGHALADRVGHDRCHHRCDG